MSTSHPCALTQAFDTIHETVRDVKRENNDLRMKNNQLAAQLDIAKKERDDALWHVNQLRGALARKLDNSAIEMTPTIKALA